MRRFASLFGVISLTDERLRHMLNFHPDVRRYLKDFPETLAAPERTVRSAHDAEVVICYRTVAKERFLAIVVKTGAAPFVLTAYIAKRPKRG